ncbi:hypothetical protein CVIRNUC_006764 [Coccomyxa viridis]|uniref:Uncharacterized protein n=1 Tax=Coccomyxa viridis TaxID=1274662 RepID=A0AAV1IAP0_9CHLO|nr:hypothetical protein CVIRNUC_006764 [Coccomyxa viridis]
MQALSGKLQGCNCLGNGTVFRSRPHTALARNRGRPYLRLSAAEQEAKTVERSEEIEERLTEEEASQIESGTGRKVEKTDAQGKIYIGFDKNDVKPRAGRKGRMIDDNEERYPSRSEMAGGWAGGEKGLRAFIQEADKQGPASQEENGSQPAAREPGTGKKSPKQAALDPGAYPGKESVGFLSGITGGFAGGERGVQQFVEKGQLDLVPPGKEKREFSVLLIAGGAAVAAALGGLLLDDGVEDVEKAVQTGNLPGLNLSTAPLDEKTKLALKVAMALLALVGVSIGARAVVKSVKEGTGRLAQRVLDIGKIGAFWIGVFVAVKFVLESSN